MTETSIIEIERLNKIYGSYHALIDLDLTVRRGEIFGLLGPNGAGKTTTIKMLMGILQPSSGAARIAGFDCFKHRPEVMRHVGYLPDEPTFYDYLRGTELLEFAGSMHGMAIRDIRARSNELVERLELQDAIRDFAVNYSTGMKKKLGLMLAMLHAPELLILDEPTNGLDPLSTRTMHQMMREQAAQGKSIFYSTHLLDQAEKLCHRTGIIYRGKLAAVGPLEELRGQLAPGSSLEDIFFAVTSQATPAAPTPPPPGPA